MAVSIAVFGAGGKMGCAIVRAVAEAEGAVLAAAIERSDYPFLAADASQTAGLAASGVTLTDRPPAQGACDVWIDFSTPAAAVPNAEAAAAIEKCIYP